MSSSPSSTLMTEPTVMGRMVARVSRSVDTNPMATIFAWSGALRKRGQLDGLTDLAAFADKLEAACFETLGDGIMTKDLVGLVDEGTPVTAVNSSEFIGAIHDRLAAKL